MNTMRKILILLFSLLCLSVCVGCTSGNISSFIKNPLVTLRYQASEGGTISGNPVQRVINGGNGKTVTAVADNGYSFVRWSDWNTNAQRRRV